MVILLLKNLTNSNFSEYNPMIPKIEYRKNVSSLKGNSTSFLMVLLKMKTMLADETIKKATKVTEDSLFFDLKIILLVLIFFTSLRFYMPVVKLPLLFPSTTHS